MLTGAAWGSELSPVLDPRVARRAFLDAIADPHQRARRDNDALDADLDDLISRARSARPGWSWDVEAWLVHLGGLVREGTPRLAELHAGDLLLTWSTARGMPEAVAAFEAEHGAEIDRGLRKVDPVGYDDLGQMLRERLCVGSSGGRARLLDYAGRGPLLHWLRVTVVRMRVDLLRRRSRQPIESRAADSLLAAAAGRDDPELAYLRGHYGELLKQAFARALAGLDAEQRSLLRQHVVGNLAATQIAGIYGVHHVTVKRWLARARELLWRNTRREVMLALGLSRHQFDSIVRLVNSELDLSVARLLAAESTADDRR